MKYALAVTVVGSLLGIVGCSGSTATGDAAITNDANLVDAAVGDAAVGEDVGSDSGSRDAARLPDAFEAPDAPPRDDTNAAHCEYTAVDDVIVLCGTEYTFVSQFTSEMSSCPPFYSFDPDGTQYASVEDAVASNPSCDATCQWHFALGVDRLYCGHRTGYEVLRATGCDDVYRFPEGYYDSVEEHDAENPCP
jgi:hypothetical protein